MLDFNCKCGQKIKVDDEHAGKSGRCPKCKQIIEIPSPAITDIEPAAIDAPLKLKQQTRECPCCGEEILETAKKCKHCGEWLVASDDRVSSNSSLSKNSKPKKSILPNRSLIRRIGRLIAVSFGIFFAISFVIIVFCIIVERISNMEKSEKTNVKKKASSKSSVSDEKKSAWIVAQMFIKDYLKSPSTASFGGSYYDIDYQNPEKCVQKMTGEKAGKNEYVVVGWVDSQNGFGAVVRATFLVTFKHEENGNWTLLQEPVFKQR